jgi:hypothetical protein
MIDCNGTHVITHRHKHGNAVYRCTLANAVKLLGECLKNETPDLRELAEELKTETRPVRPFEWLVKALSEVLEMKESTPVRLRIVLFGAGPKLRDDPDPRPVPVISKEMQDELVLFFFRNRFDLQMLSGRLTPTLEMVTAAWNSLSFLEPARQRLAGQGGPDVRFIENYMSEALDALKPLQKNSWKADAREERVVGQFVTFFNEHASGTWDVEQVQDL